MSCDCEDRYTSETEEVTICNPSNTIQPIIPSSCLTKSALLRIIDSWNYSNPDKKIEDAETMSANSLYRLVESHMKSTYKCESEDCWIESLEHPYGVRDQLLSLFKPEYPENFREDKNAWWSSSQIDAVIRPYTFSHPFYWCGVVPLDFKEQRQMKLCLSREVCAMNMKNLVEQGCCIVGAIFNLDYSWQNGSHWVVGVIDIKRGSVGFMDSYGYEPPQLIKDWIVNCVSSLNRLALEGEWCNCESYRLTLSPSDMKWKSYESFTITKSVPRHLKVDPGMILVSKSSGRKFEIIERTDRKTFAIKPRIHKREEDDDFIIIGARSFCLSKKVQKSSTECGSFCIHVILEALKGKSWHSIMKDMPSDYKIKQLRTKLHRNI